MAAAGPLVGAALLLLLERHQAAGASARHLRTVVRSAACSTVTVTAVVQRLQHFSSATEEPTAEVQ
jgi:hypothetical protein